MAHVRLDLTCDFDAAPTPVWDALVDWKGHEAWIPATEVEVHTDGDPAAVGAEFTAWSGLGRRFALEDRMRVDEATFDPSSGTGTCKVTKLGPTITGWAGFTIEPHASGSRVVWIEAVEVPYAPQFSAPLLAKIGAIGFRLGLRRLDKQLAAQAPLRAVA